MNTKNFSLTVHWCTFACIWLSYHIQRNSASDNSNCYNGVRLYMKDRKHVVVDNGFVQLTLRKPDGLVTGVKYKGLDNVLEVDNQEDDRGYWDVVWSKPGDCIIFDKLRGTDFSVIMENDDQVEVSFTKTWNISYQNSTVPLNVDKRFIVRQGSSGFYAYAILERLEGWPDVDMDQIRIVFKLQNDKFHYMAISDVIQREMPTLRDRKAGLPLAYPEAVLLTHPSNPFLKGEVDDKYQYSTENKDNKVTGWISEDPPVGFWIITPSHESYAGGPVKQDLTCHVGPTLLSMFTSIHYAGKDMNTQYRNGEPWKKVFGPIFVYLNSINSSSLVHQVLWNDAKRQMLIEEESWPYNFPQSKDFPRKDQRGSVGGQLVVQDRYINDKPFWASFAYVGLAAPGDAGSWPIESKGFQFWTQADLQGNFLIENVREGDYNLYGWVPGIIGNYKYNSCITIKPGCQIKLGVITYAPPRNGPTLWEIGIPDRSAAEFFVPNPYPFLVNRLYINKPKQKFRQYGLWKRYTDLYPKHDLIYEVGVSHYTKDWFFAHVPRYLGNKTCQPTTWQIIFGLENLQQNGNYTLQLALAAASNSDLQVRFNNMNSTSSPHFRTGFIGKDNAIARHGIHGLYHLFSITLSSQLLVQGRNTLYLTQARPASIFAGVMYDYIRLEGPNLLIMN